MPKPSFETQVNRLEQIVAILDKGSAPIDELLKLYQEGMKLATQCRVYLEKAEQQVISINHELASTSSTSEPLSPDD